MKLINEIKKINNITDYVERERKFEELGDEFEYENYENNQDLISAVEYLLNCSLEEKKLVVKESIFNVIDIALVKYNISNRINFDYLASKIDNIELNCLEYAINFLAYSRNVKYKEIIENYLNHSNNIIAQAARNGIRYFE